MVKYNHNCTGLIKLSDLKVTRYTLGFNPKLSKIEEAVTLFAECGTLRPIVINEDNVMVDGFKSLLVARICRLTEVPYIVMHSDVTEDNRINFIDTPWYKDPIQYIRKQSEKPVKPIVNKSKPVKMARPQGTKVNSSYYKNIFARQNGLCYICNRQMTLDARFKETIELATLDHIIPVALGGPGDLSNVALCCHRCNELKGSLMMCDELRNIIIRQRNYEDSIGFKSVMKQDGDRK